MKLRKITSMLLAFMLVFTCMIIPATSIVNADSPMIHTKYKTSATVTRISTVSYDYIWLDMGKKIYNAKSVKVKSDNNSVVSFDSENHGKDYGTIYLLAKKSGTANLTIKIKKSSGTNTYKMKIKVVAYENPFKSFKIGTKNIKKKYNKSNWYDMEIAKAKVKINITPKAGWTIKKIKYNGKKSKMVPKSRSAKAGESWKSQCTTSLQEAK